MEPYKARMLPISYNLDNQTIRLLGLANEKYGEYKSLLKTLAFDQKYFLDLLVLDESIRSSRIDGIQIFQDDMYYLNYKSLNDSIEEVKNLKEMIDYANIELKNKNINLNDINFMHKKLLAGVRGKDKYPGLIRKDQDSISIKENTTFIPPTSEDIEVLIDNLIIYMNDSYSEDAFLKTAISHFQFETIQPYNNGNGRMGRALITLQVAKLKADEPILYLSEIMELYKANYYNALSECRNGNVEGFIRFFLQCIVDQCTRNINRITRINNIYNEDQKLIQDNFNGNIINRLHPIMLKRVVFTIDEIAKELKVHHNSILVTLNKLIELGMVIKEKKPGTKKVTYKYIKVYDTFIDQI